MSDSTAKARIVLTTAANPEEARHLGRTFVEEHLAACATLIPSVESIYPWEGKIESAAETILVLKTDSSQIQSLEARLHSLHSYKTPEFLVLPVESGSEGYLDWMRAHLHRP